MDRWFNRRPTNTLKYSDKSHDMQLSIHRIAHEDLVAESALERGIIRELGTAWNKVVEVFALVITHELSFLSQQVNLNDKQFIDKKDFI